MKALGVLVCDIGISAFDPPGERFTFARTATSPIPDADPFTSAVADRIGAEAVPPK